MINKNVSMFLRGIGTFLVILAHYSQWYLTMADGNAIWLLLSKTGRYGVAIFFMVSGYGLVFSAGKGLDTHWICRRIYNVYFPYIVIVGIIHLLERKQWTFKGVVRYVLGMDAWFVFVIIIFYIIFYAAWKFCEHRMLWITAGVLFASAALAVTIKDSVWYASNISFLVGVAAGQYDQEIGEWLKDKRKMCSIVLLIAFFCSGGVYTFFTGRSEVIYLIGKIAASALWAMLLIAMFANKDISNRAIEKIGAASLEVYLIHVFVLQVLGTMSDEIGAIVVLLIATVLTLVLGQLIHRLFIMINSATNTFHINSDMLR